MFNIGERDGGAFRFLSYYCAEKSMSIIDMLKTNPSLVQEIVRQRDAKAGETIQEIDNSKRIAIYGHRYSINGYPLDAVIWQNAYITMIESYNDVVSFGFGGCVMANFYLNNRFYTAHIHNADIYHQHEDGRINWIQYVKSNGIKINSMFRPANESFNILTKIRSSVCIWGVCTPMGKNYSLILDHEEKHLISIREYQTPYNYNEILKLHKDSNYNSVCNTWNKFWQNKQHYRSIYENHISSKLTDW